LTRRVSLAELGSQPPIPKRGFTTKSTKGTEGKDLRGLVAIVGKDALSDRDKKFLEFADMFEDRFVRQGMDENRDIETTLELGWDLLSALPEAQLTRIDDKYIQKYHPAHKGKEKKE